MNIVFASDQNYIEHLAVSMCSLFENNRNASIDVYVINTDIDESTWSVLESIAKKYGQKLIDVKIVDEELDGAVLCDHFTKAAYYRLFIPEKIPVDKVLYLDSDVVVVGSIETLYETNIEGFYEAAVINPNFYRHQDLDMLPDAKYFNSGVLLINVPLWHRDDMKGKVLKVVRGKPWAIQFPDQDSLNSVANGRWKEVHPRFNVQGYFFDQPTEAVPLFPDGELIAALEHPTILHYSGSMKPWFFNSTHPLKMLYWKYQRMTPFRRRVPKDLTLMNILKRAIPKPIKRVLKRSSY